MEFNYFLFYFFLSSSIYVIKSFAFLKIIYKLDLKYKYKSKNLNECGDYDKTEENRTPSGSVFKFYLLLYIFFLTH